MLATCLVMSGCGTEKLDNEDKTSNESDKNEIEEVEKPDREETEEKEDKVEVLTGKIYYIDDESGQTMEEEVEVETLDANTIWKKMQEKGIVPGDATVLSFVQNGDTLELDLDEKFGEYIRRQGSMGEQEILKCIVNTYLDNFSAQKLKITEEGMVFSSGHAIYDSYFTKME